MKIHAVKHIQSLSFSSLVRLRWFKAAAVISAVLMLTACLETIKTYGTNDPAKFGSPVGIIVDEAGYIYVSDIANGTVKKIDSTGETVATIGSQGSGDGELNIPMDMAYADGKIYVPELGNKRVQVFDTASGELLQIIGEGVVGSVRSVAVADNGDVYALDEFNHRVVVFNPDGSVKTIIGSFGVAPGQFNIPNSIAVNGNNVYVADRGNHRVQQLDLEGNVIRTVGSFGTGVGQFNTPRGVTTDPSGNVYVSDTVNHRLVKFDADLNYLATMGNAFVFYAPNSVDFDPDGNIVVADTGNHLVKKFSADTFTLLAVYGTPRIDEGEFNTTAGVAFNQSTKEVFVADSFNHRIQVFDLKGNFLRTFGGFGFDEAGLFFPRGIDLDAEGNLYVADMVNHRVKKYDPQGNVLAIFGSEGYAAGQFNFPTDVELDNNGNIYVSEIVGSRVQKFDTNHNFVSVIGGFGFGDGQFFQAKSIAFDADNNMYVCDYGSHRINKFDPEGNFIKTWGKYGSDNGDLNWPDSIIIDENKRVIVGDANMSLSVYDLDGNFIKREGSLGAESDELFFPIYMEDAPGRAFFVSNSLTHNVRLMVMIDDEAISQLGASMTSKEHGFMDDVEDDDED
ncbi:MAG: SMP-30/gluconolactonase/LRE family protein [Cellvibrionaceae bacterium]